MQQIHKITQPFPEIQDLTKAFIDIYLDAKKKFKKSCNQICGEHCSLKLEK